MGGEGLPRTSRTNDTIVTEESPLPCLKEIKSMQSSFPKGHHSSNLLSSQNTLIHYTLPLEYSSKTVPLASLNYCQRRLKKTSVHTMSQNTSPTINNRDHESISLSGDRLPHISGSNCAPDIVTSHPLRKDSPGHDNPAYHAQSGNSLPDADASIEKTGSKSVNVEVHHVQQQHSWDCGIACVMMVLPETHRRHLGDNLDDICKQEGFHKSTWTIDLAYLLRRFGVPFRYYTVTLGVDPGLNSETFYQHAIYKDAMRVVERFQTASHYGVTVQQLTVSLSIIVQHLSLGLPVIVLTNARLLRCRLCPRRSLRSCFASACQSNDHYQGHFVVLSGVDRAARLIYYANPSSREQLCCCSFQQMEDARLSYGTDEDIIFVDRR